MANLFSGVTRTSFQIEEELRTALASVLPEIKDIDKDIFVRGLRLFADLYENIHFYLDQQALESNIYTARLLESAVLQARAKGTRVKGFTPFEVELTFTLSANAPSVVTIPAGTVVQTKTGTPYRTQSEVQIGIGENTVTVAAKQLDFVASESFGVTTGEVSQSFVIENKVADKAVTVRIDSEVYTPVESFFESGPEDTHIVCSLDKDENTVVEFGDGKNGKIPAVNKTINVDYFLCIGAAGKTGTNTITEIQTAITLPEGLQLSCTNEQPASGGRNGETLAELKTRLPLQALLRNTILLDSDYVRFAETLPQVDKAAAFYLTGTEMQLYIVPQGGGIANDAVIDSVKDVFIENKIFCTDISVFPVGVVQVGINLNLTVKRGQRNDEAEAEIRALLSQFFSYQNQSIKGGVGSDEIYAEIRKSERIQNALINAMFLIPYATPKTGKQLDWTVALVKPLSVPARWVIRFISTTEFQVIRGETLIGVFEVGNSIDLTEITFTVNDEYVSGDNWEFYTYQYLTNNAGIFALQEFSLLAIEDSNITITTTGGI